MPLYHLNQKNKEQPIMEKNLKNCVCIYIFIYMYITEPLCCIPKTDTML